MTTGEICLFLLSNLFSRLKKWCGMNKFISAWTVNIIVTANRFNDEIFFWTRTSVLVIRNSRLFRAIR